MSDATSGVGPREPRLRKFDVGDLDLEQRALYDAITGGPRAQGVQAFRLVDADGGLEGPFNALLLSPEVGGALQALGSRLRYGSALSDRAREIVILLVAHHWSSAFEIYAHAAVGAQIGLSEDELTALRDGRLDTLDDAYERVAAEVAHALLRRHDLTDDEYDVACAELGAAALFEITTFVGYYATLALQLRVYRVSPPA